MNSLKEWLAFEKESYAAEKREQRWAASYLLSIAANHETQIPIVIKDRSSAGKFFKIYEDTAKLTSRLTRRPSGEWVTVIDLPQIPSRPMMMMVSSHSALSYQRFSAGSCGII